MRKRRVGRAWKESSDKLSTAVRLIDRGGRKGRLAFQPIGSNTEDVMRVRYQIKNDSWLNQLSGMVRISTLMAFPFGVLEPDVFHMIELADSDELATLNFHGAGPNAVQLSGVPSN